MLITRKKEVVAVCIEDYDSLLKGDYVRRWESIIENGVKLMLVVKDKKSHEKVKTAAADNNIEAVIRYVERGVKKKNSSSSSPMFDRQSKVDWVIALTIVVVLLAFVVLILPDLLSYFKMKDFYQPYDRERQEEYMKKREEEYKGMSDDEREDKVRDDMRLKRDHEKRIKEMKK